MTVAERSEVVVGTGRGGQEGGSSFAFGEQEVSEENEAAEQEADPGGLPRRAQLPVSLVQRMCLAHGG